jgi:hypothetical protein
MEYFLLKNKILIINMSYYQCKRCSHTCKQKIEMIRHLERINKCKRDVLSCNYSDQDIYDKSLIKIKYISIKNNLITKNNDTINNSVNNTNINSINDNDNNNININKNNLNNYLTNEDITNLTILNKIKLLNYNKHSNQSDNKIILNNFINQNDTPLFLCNYCLKNFSRQYNLDRHKCKLKINPFKHLNYNIFHLNFNILPFEYDWDIKHITKYTKHAILLSNIMYSNLLNIILENEKNLNVLLEFETMSAIICSNNNHNNHNNHNKFINIDLKYLIDKTMEKLHNHLNNIYNDSLNEPEFLIKKDRFENQKKMIDDKYLNYKEDVNVQNKVKKCIIDIYNIKKENTLIYFNKILFQNNDNIYDINNEGY